MPASIALVATSVSASPSVGSSTIASTLSLMKVSTWLICWLASLVPSALLSSTSSYFLASASAELVDRGQPAVVGRRAGEADDDLLAGLVVVAARPLLAALRRLEPSSGSLLVQPASSAPAASGAPVAEQQPAAAEQSDA